MENTVLERVRAVIDFSGLSINGFAQAVSVPQSTLNNMLSRGSEPSLKTLQSIIDTFEEINPLWLLKGDGDMQKGDMPSRNYNYKGAPYYDVDFIGGFDLVLEDNTVNPEYYIDLPPYNKPGIVWCNLYGKSMEPFIMSGDRIALKEIQVDDVIFGKAYGIITQAGLRTVKWVVRSPEKGNYRLVPENKDPKFGDYQDIEIKSIFKVFLILGAVRAF